MYTDLLLGTESQVPIPDCDLEGLHYTYTFSVRAVNIGPDNVTYYGPWSSPGEGNCYASGKSRIPIINIPWHLNSNSIYDQNADWRWDYHSGAYVLATE